MVTRSETLRLRLIGSRITTPIIAFLAILSLATAQPPAEPAQPNGFAFRFSEPVFERDGIRLPMADRRRQRQLQLAYDNLAKNRVDEAVIYLQAILDSENDAFSIPDRDTSKSVSLRAEAARVLSSLSDEAKQAYELRYGVTARSLLDESLRTGTWDRLADVARRFPTTAAGEEAQYRLAKLCFDRGDLVAATISFENLHQTAAPPLQQQALLHQILCELELHPESQVNEQLKELLRHQRTWKVAGREESFTSATELKAALFKEGLSRASPSTEWSATRGGPSRENFRPVVEGPAHEWQSSSIHLPLMTIPQDDIEATEKTLGSRIAEAKLSLLASGQPEICSSHPVAVGDLVLFRTVGNITALSVTTGELQWRSLNDPLFEECFAADPRETRDGIAVCRSLISQRIYGDATWGTLGADHEIVFAIEESGSAEAFLPIDNNATNADSGPQLVSPTEFNRLVGYDAATGRRCFEAGGPPNQTEPLSGMFFLGPPVSLGERWYVLGELRGRIELIEFDPTRHDSPRWRQPISDHDLPISHDRSRRTAGLSPCVCGGLLICPAGSGLFVAVDPYRRSLLWAYRTTPDATAGAEPPQFFGPFSPSNRTVQASRLESLVATRTMVLVGDKTGTVVAIDPRTGAEVWSARVPDFLWIVGADHERTYLQFATGVMAFNLDDGTTAWERPAAIGPPAGLGVIVGDRLFLPLSSGSLAVVEAITGHHVETVHAPENSHFGNLIVRGNSLISLSATQIASMRLPQ